MNKQTFRIYYITTGVLTFVLILLVFLPSKKQNTDQTKNTTNQPTPTTYDIFSRLNGLNSKNSTISSTLVPATNFTGVKEERLSTEASSLIIQKQNLKKKMPLQGNYFNITFDYNEDKFIVELKEPKETSKKNFEQWLKLTYSAIPIDRFTIK